MYLKNEKYNWKRLCLLLLFFNFYILDPSASFGTVASPAPGRLYHNAQSFPVLVQVILYIPNFPSTESLVSCISWKIIINERMKLKTNMKLKVLGKSVGLCKTTKRKDQLYISLLVSVWRIICENFNPNGLILAEI